MTVDRIATSLQRDLPSTLSGGFFADGHVVIGLDGKKVEPYYFDGRRGATALPLDVGFSSDALSLETVAFSATEFFTLLGLQRFRPADVKVRVYRYRAWSAPRLVLVPIPSIEPRGRGAEAVGAVRRVMVFSTDTRGTDTAWAARALGGMDLIDENTGEFQAVLAATSRHDRVLERYVSESSAWATVTPVVLPGHDDPGGLREKLRRTTCGEKQKTLLERLMKRREALVRKALLQAGIGDELASSAAIEMRETGFIAGVEKASRYAVPSHLTKSPRLHVKLTWPVRVAGPLCIGRGRFSGLGLFASVSA
jgi:CRISPR-associated protein Csb2